MATLSDAINQARQTFPEMSQARAVGYAAIVHKRLLQVLNIRENTASITMTADTMDYDLPTDVASIFAVLYYSSATNYQVLSVTSWEEMDEGGKDWRSGGTTGTPSKYIVRSIKDTDPTDKFILSLWPVPDTTASAGYPCVKLWYVDHSALTSTSDALPGTLLDDRVYVNGIRALYAEDNALDKTEFYQNAFYSDLDRCMRFIRDMTINEEGPRLVRPHFSGTGVV